MKSTRDRILQTLLLNPNSTIGDLAEAVDINSVSVRHHLTNLQAEGLVQSAEVRHGVGRPRLVYSLTDNGAELFPTRYLRLVNHLFAQLKNRMSKKDLEKILVQIASDISADQVNKIRTLPVDEKLAFVQQFLVKEGYIIEWEKKGSNYIINEISCPFNQISVSHPEVCVIDKTIFSTLLSVPVEKVKCILSGDSHCAYMFSQPTIQEN